MSLLVHILAHSDIQKTFDRHLPHWQAMGGDLLVWHPTDKPIHVKDVQTIAIGRSGHSGKQAINRFRAIIATMGRSDHSEHIFYEYDSFSLVSAPPSIPNDTIVGNFFNDLPGNAFGSTSYPHPPLMMTCETAATLSNAMDALTSDQVGGMWDRLVGRAIDRLVGRAIDRTGLKTINLLKVGTGYSANTIVPAFYGNMINEIKAGAVHLHGVKTKECYELAIKVYGETKQ